MLVAYVVFCIFSRHQRTTVILLFCLLLVHISEIPVVQLRLFHFINAAGTHCQSPDVIHYLFLTFYLLTWRIWGAPNNASKGQMGFNSVLKG